MPRNPRADQIGTGGRIKSESPGGCARNAHLPMLRKDITVSDDTHRACCVFWMFMVPLLLRPCLKRHA